MPDFPDIHVVPCREKLGKKLVIGTRGRWTALVSLGAFAPHVRDQALDLSLACFVLRRHLPFCNSQWAWCEGPMMQRCWL